MSLVLQLAMDIILAGLRWTTCLVYLDERNRLLGNVRTTFATTPISAGFPCKSQPETKMSPIQNFPAIAQPLTLLTKKDIPFFWGTDKVKSFNALKEALTSASVPAHPNFD
ncbi:hypothetical protein OUZ56_012748 [Daphnia magna]|uniref:Uncharacterized protein n=1 Tax=Daphnia magna TaxID=35525 RepID=A0ABQ9Z3Y3_9CRUS|nr:hypothetical protein OUZ56_012748 [Daphnia magna]